MTNNLPPDFSAVLRRGATFGPVIFTVTGLNLSLYSLSAGIGADDVAPTISAVTPVVTDEGTLYQFSVTVPAALTLSLKTKTIGTQSSGLNTWWLDATLISDSTVVVPLVGGELTVVARGGHD